MRKLLLLVSLCTTFSLVAQESSHSRLGVLDRPRVAASIGIDTSLQSLDDGLSIISTLEGEVSFDRVISLSASIPGDLELGLSRKAIPRAAFALGDPEFAMGNSFRLADWRLGANLSFRYALGIWNPYEAEEKRIVTSNGYSSMALGLSGNRFLDPIVLQLRATARTSFPREDRFGESWRPLELGLTTGMAEALNDSVSLGLSASQSLRWPTIASGISDARGYIYSLSGTVSLSVSDGDISTLCSLSRDRVDMSTATVFGIAISHSFKSRR